MPFPVTAAKMLQVQFGVTDATYDGNAIPIPDGDNDLVITFSETLVPVHAMGNDSILANFRSRQDLESVAIPFIQTGEDLFDLIFGGLSGGGSAPALVTGLPLIVTGRVGTLTAWAASPQRAVSFPWGDTAVTSVALPFSCTQDITRAVGETVWTFVPAA